MVASTAQLHPAIGARWFNYLTLSLLGNALLISLITMPPLPTPVTTPERLAIKLKARAAPPPATPVTEAIEAEPAPAPTPEKKQIITDHRASEKIVAPVTKPEPATALFKKEAPVAEAKKTVQPPAPLTKQQPENRTETVPEQTAQPTPGVTSSPTRLTTADASGQKQATDTDSGQNLTTVVQEARYRRQVPPTYPRRALELDQQGTVTLHARVKPDGMTEELKIVETSGHALLDKAALAAVKKWEFEPVLSNGVATTSWVRVPIEFVIQ